MLKTPEPTICLCMIVKNEAAVIARSLESIRDHLDYWIICDTGSTDATVMQIRSALDGVRGELHHMEWKNFGHNRTEAIRLANGKADYLLLLDADMVVNIHAPFKDKLIDDFYEIRYEGDLDYSQPLLISNHHSWEYNGVTHEYISSPTAASWSFLPQLSIIHYGDGANRRDKFERDIELLTNELEKDPGHARNMFYLAQSYRDLGQWQKALEWYEKRVASAGWEEEQWYALYQAADMKNRLGYPWPQTLAAYQAAFDARPVRLEPLYAIARHYRESCEFFQGYVYSAVALQGLVYPEMEKLFIEKPVYDCLLLLEFVACALACGRISETIQAANLLLSRKEIPVTVRNAALDAREMAGSYLGMGNSRKGAESSPNKIVVIVPFYNPGDLLAACVKSLLEQDHADFRVIFIDDASSDSNKHFRVPLGLDAELVTNEERKGCAYNLHYAVTNLCDSEDIVVCLDGDDQLACHNALTLIDNHYRQKDCWVMYGQYEDMSGQPGVSAPFASARDFATLRQSWRVSHIRTFRAGLFHAIAKQDPEYSCLKDRDGQWLHSAVDAALMFPLLEMADFHRVAFNEKVLYRYTTDNPLSHHHADKLQQSVNFHWVCSMRPFARVTKYHSEKILTHSI